MLSSIRAQLIVFFVGVTSVIMMGQAGYTYLSTQSRLQAELASAVGDAQERLLHDVPRDVADFRQEQARVGDRLKTSLPTSVYNFDDAQALSSLQAEMADPRIMAIVVTEPSGSLFVGLERRGEAIERVEAVPADATDQVSDLVLPDSGETIGRVAVYWSPEALPSRIERLLRTELNDQRMAAVSVSGAGLDMHQGELPTGELATLTRDDYTVGVYPRPTVVSDGLAVERTRSLTQIIVLELAIVFAVVFIAQTIRRRLVTAVSTLGNNAEELRVEAASIAGTSAQTVENAVTVTTSAGQMTNNIGSLADITEEFTANIATISRNAQALAERANQTAEGLGELTTRSEDVSNLAQSGSAIAHDAAESSVAMRKVVEELVGAASKVGAITAVIKGIADQTNLLALNATIEAASAGEAGRGFAVVASEIKELAGQCTRAADDIAATITGMQQTVKTVGSAITGIETVIDRLTEATAEIAGNANDQRQTVAGMSSAIEGVTSDLSATTGAISEINSGSEVLSRTAHELADDARKVADSIRVVHTLAESGDTAAGQLQRIAGDLGGLVTGLERMAGRVKRS
ncbi:MAG: methyl-accepting chemotaxis protein [Planctomycetota bacterium]|jgi:methyl-accepting chemotaxis protein|nr:methyl-accepting chemotaxis protein [Planctomycetota bacterium]